MNNKNKRKRIMIQYNPTPRLSFHLKKYRLQLIKKIKNFFNKTNPLTKIFNKHKMRTRYLCTSRLKRLIKLHNQKILNKSNLIKNQCNFDGCCTIN